MMESFRRRTGSFGASLKIEPESVVVAEGMGLSGMATATATATATA
eukprot:CAMPEP_0182570866 /NCGR_PEP_ID=MMETSP1324-20130603/11047_1 /TAXON_ID=236786 /ORGANISM="Florenciella sp., Strain RCC1587" /LENGTH=45 /DNA_ID= /DNA_START= /DNA_END= /DNA_ORIENTATION=